MARMLPFGVDWPVNAAMRERVAYERARFVSWIEQQQVPEVQRLVLCALLDKVDDSEFVDGRCAGFTYAAEIARRTGIPTGVEEILHALETADYLCLHPAGEVFGDQRPGIIFRIRRPDVVLTVQSAGPLWKADTHRQWTRPGLGPVKTGIPTRKRRIP